MADRGHWKLGRNTTRGRDRVGILLTQKKKTCDRHSGADRAGITGYALVTSYLLKVALSPASSAWMVSPGANLPDNTSCASGFSSHI